MEGLASILGSAVWAELGLAWGVDDDIRTLQRRMSTMNAVLGDAEARAISDMALRKWLRDLEEVAVDAEKALDELRTEAELQEGKKENVFCCLCSYFSSLLFRNKMAREIKDIVKRFEEAAEERTKFHLAEGAPVARRRRPPAFSRQVEELEMVGRDGDKEAVMEWLMEVDEGMDVSVLPIVGSEGMGKTTLAGSVYNDGSVMKHFEIRIWVSVGEDLDLNAIAQGMLERVAGESSASLSLGGMYRLIREKITDTRYLLVLDDVWCEDGLKWESLKDMLRGSSRGNKVVVTTRSGAVAAVAGTAESACELRGLSDDDCWAIFRHKAFSRRDADEHPNLVRIGKEIVQRCRGVPLAAKWLGMLVATAQDEGEWLAVKDKLWGLDQDAAGLVIALWRSFRR